MGTWWQGVRDGFRYGPDNSPTCPRWSAQLNELLDVCEVTDADAHVCRIGKVPVWVANWPYAYGSPYRDDARTDRLPDMATRRRLRKHVAAARDNGEEARRLAMLVRESIDEAKQRQASGTCPRCGCSAGQCRPDIQEI